MASEKFIWPEPKMTPSIFDISRQVSSSRSTIEYLRSLGMLVDSLKCKKCEWDMVLETVAKKQSSDCQRWKCTNRKCRTTCSIRNGSIFQVKFFNYSWECYDTIHNVNHYNDAIWALWHGKWQENGLFVKPLFAYGTKQNIKNKHYCHYVRQCTTDTLNIPRKSQ